MLANCLDARPDGAGGLLVARQVLGGSAVEDVRLEPHPAGPAVLTAAAAGPAVAAATAGSGTAHLPDGPLPGAARPQVRRFTPTLTEHDLLGRVRRVEPAPSGGADLAKARVVVGGGRGVGGADRFGPLLELAEELGGALGVSRVVTSLGWRPHHEQVGQTGTRIRPEVYLACGISGAIQHWAGCSGARTVIAINTDPDAPMVTRADYAVIGDLHEVVPAITAELRARAR
jgi:electron transfer flavoprotein alpha subunit